MQTARSSEELKEELNGQTASLRRAKLTVNRAYKCSQCSKGLSSLPALVWHEKSIHHVHYSGEKKFQCKMCSTKCHTEAHLNLHVKAKHENQSGNVPCFECDICGLVMHSMRVYNAHKRKLHMVDDGNNKFVCEFCGKAYKRKDVLRWHTKTQHMGIKRPRKNEADKERTYQCDKCEKSFKRRQHLDDHISLKHKSKDSSLKYKCDRCTESFLRPHNLEYHTNKVHLQEKPYKCKNCNEAFYSAVAMRKHFRLCSLPDSERYSCEVCAQLFTTKRNLRMHSEAMHTLNPLTCECGVVVKWRSSLAKHRRKCELYNAKLMDDINQEQSEAQEKEEGISNTLYMVENEGTSQSKDDKSILAKADTVSNLSANTDAAFANLPNIGGVEVVMENEAVIGETGDGSIRRVSTIIEGKDEGQQSVYYVILKE